MPFYCGHHKVHCFQALGLMTPSGMLAAFGPFDGKLTNTRRRNKLLLVYELWEKREKEKKVSVNNVQLERHNGWHMQTAWTKSLLAMTSYSCKCKWSVTKVCGVVVGGWVHIRGWSPGTVSNGPTSLWAEPELDSFSSRWKCENVIFDGN